MRRFKRHNFLTNFLRITGYQQINLYSLNIKFQEKIFTNKKVNELWNFGNFGLPKIIPKSLVTLRFSKVSLHELKGNCKCFQMRYWPIFYVHPTYNSTHFSTRPGGSVIICPPLYFTKLKSSNKKHLKKISFSFNS